MNSFDYGKILRGSLGLKDGESITFVYDSDANKIADEFIKHLEDGNENEVRRQKLYHGTNKIEQLINAFSKSKVIIIILSRKEHQLLVAEKDIDNALQSLLQTPRVLVLQGVEMKDFVPEGPFDIDYHLIEKNNQSIIKQISENRSLRVCTDEGTDITFTVAKDKIFSHSGSYITASDGGYLPSGDIYMLTRMDCSGVIVFDGLFDKIGDYSNSPLKVSVNNCKIVDVNPRRKEDFFSKKILYLPFEKFGEQEIYIAEFSIGTNYRINNMDKRIQFAFHAKGNCSFAIGRNTHIGGEFKSKLHLHGIVKNPKMYLKKEYSEIPLKTDYK